MNKVFFSATNDFNDSNTNMISELLFKKLGVGYYSNYTLFIIICIILKVK